MRILHCLRAPVGGLFRHVLDLAGAQANLGHEVGMIIDANATDGLTEQRLAAITPRLAFGIKRIAMHRLPGFTDLAAHRDVLAHVASCRSDVLHGHGAKGGAYARLAGRALKAKGQPLRVYYTPHGGTLNYPHTSLEGRMYLGLEKVLDGMTDGLIFESAFAADTYQRRVGDGRAPRRVIHNGLRALDFAPVVADINATDFLYIGELRDLKGVDTLLRALAGLNALSRAPISATIVGSGPQASELKQLALQLGLSSNTRFPGALPAATAFAMGRALVVPSRRESFPYVVLEAAAASLPLIATNVGGIPEIVEGTDTELIACDDVRALIAAMAAVRSDPAAAQARAVRLNAVVAERFTVAAMTAAVMSFYGEATGKQAAAQAFNPASPPPPSQSRTLRADGA